MSTNRITDEQARALVTGMVAGDEPTLKQLIVSLASDLLDARCELAALTDRNLSLAAKVRGGAIAARRAPTQEIVERMWRAWRDRFIADNPGESMPEEATIERFCVDLYTGKAAAQNDADRAALDAVRSESPPPGAGALVAYLRHMAECANHCQWSINGEPPAPRPHRRCDEGQRLAAAVPPLDAESVIAPSEMRCDMHGLGPDRCVACSMFVRSLDEAGAHAATGGDVADDAAPSEVALSIAERSRALRAPAPAPVDDADRAFVRRWLGTGEPSEDFEPIGAWFYAETGLLRPGKDAPPGHASRDERERAWVAWCEEKRLRYRAIVGAMLDGKAPAPAHIDRGPGVTHAEDGSCCAPAAHRDLYGLRAVISAEPSGSDRIVAVPVRVLNQLVGESVTVVAAACAKTTVAAPGGEIVDLRDAARELLTALLDPRVGLAWTEYSRSFNRKRLRAQTKGETERAAFYDAADKEFKAVTDRVWSAHAAMESILGKAPAPVSAPAAPLAAETAYVFCAGCGSALRWGAHPDAPPPATGAGSIRAWPCVRCKAPAAPGDEGTRAEIARILGMIAVDGLPGPRDLDGAIDSILATLDGWRSTCPLSEADCGDPRCGVHHAECAKDGQCWHEGAAPGDEGRDLDALVTRWRTHAAALAANGRGAAAEAIDQCANEIAAIGKPGDEEIANPAPILDGNCAFCGKPTDSLAANPSRWPLWFPHPDAPGKVRPNHVGCVTGRLFGKPGDEVREAARDELREAGRLYLLYQTLDHIANEAQRETQAFLFKASDRESADALEARAKQERTRAAATNAWNEWRTAKAAQVAWGLAHLDELKRAVLAGGEGNAK